MWKRRIRTSPSAHYSDMEITLLVEWETEANEDALPKAATRKDPLLWAIWVMRTEWTYRVNLLRVPGSVPESQTFKSEKLALAEMKRLAKVEFPRSKNVDYGFPLDDTPAG
jgi:hypothetical protein